jgi:hypothetical protein
MKIRVGGRAAAAGLVGLWFAVSAFGQSDVTIDTTGMADPGVQALGSYAGYYTGTVTANGATAAANPGFISDDYNNEVFLPQESWQAVATPMASLLATPSLLSSTSYGNLGDYVAMGYLASLMNGASAQQQADLSAAIWDIGSMSSNNAIPWSSLDVNAQDLVLLTVGPGGLVQDFGLPNSPVSQLLQASIANLWIYTPTGDDVSPGGAPPQEFIGSAPATSVPEGGAPWFFLLLAGGTCLGAMFFRRRKQSAKSASN